MNESEKGWGETLFVDRTARSLGRKEGTGRASCRELSSLVRCVQNPMSYSEVSTKTQYVEAKHQMLEAEKQCDEHLGRCLEREGQDMIGETLDGSMAKERPMGMEIGRMGFESDGGTRGRGVKMKKKKIEFPW
ncbi:MAG: hypothetical protein ALECFALPRED_003010 [Alectoria fallacina]|uniref:Uncharacterized protein n=1 Tax=Alectoria fallacina TaxID=1903189 RepID=A0A8H3EB82_9LECA|nr:MAG: hypothetical protein ALECFALPRED_003010 [Alectoria fallacina]